jgi:hypothetical protein
LTRQTTACTDSEAGVYPTGPQTLREIALAIGAFGDRPFLVYRDERWTSPDCIAGRLSMLAPSGISSGSRSAATMVSRERPTANSPTA